MVGRQQAQPTASPNTVRTSFRAGSLRGRHSTEDEYSTALHILPRLNMLCNSSLLGHVRSYFFQYFPSSHETNLPRHHVGNCIQPCTKREAETRAQPRRRLTKDRHAQGTVPTHHLPCAIPPVATSQRTLRRTLERSRRSSMMNRPTTKQTNDQRPRQTNAVFAAFARSRGFELRT